MDVRKEKIQTFIFFPLILFRCLDIFGLKVHADIFKVFFRKNDVFYRAFTNSSNKINICKLTQFYIEENINSSYTFMHLTLQHNQIISKESKILLENTTCSFMQMNCK